jgi:uncharacterized cupin superfamily protein
MKPKIVKATSLKEFMTPERCFISENWGLISSKDEGISIALARVEPGVTTKAHHLEGTKEIYLIVKGEWPKLAVWNLLRLRRETLS